MRAILFTTVLLLIIGCTRPLKEKKETLIPKSSFLAKTFGQINLRPATSLIQFKTISIYSDFGIAQTLDETNEVFDYLFLTQPQSEFPPFRSELKIICPATSVESLQKKGFKKIKAITTGGKVLLKKDGSFLFVRAIEYDNQSKNGYLLEYENGRNVFISGPVSHSDQLRSFVYTLRDEGKEIHLALMARNQVDTTSYNNKEEQMADVIALLQPALAVVLRGENDTEYDQHELDKYLKEKLFYGQIYLAKKKDKIPF